MASAQGGIEGMSKNHFANVEPFRKPTSKLSRDLIEIALEKTPTGGNAKPFAWRWLENTLQVRHDLSLAEHYLNRNNHASWIALGCMIASVEAAARSQGWKAEVELTNNIGAKIIFSQNPGQDADPQVIRALSERSTYRGPLKKSEAPGIQASQQSGIQVRIAAASSLSEEFKKYIVTSDTYLWLQKKAMLSFFKEVRFFDHRFSPRGIRSQDLGVGLMDQVMLFFFSFVPWLLSLVARVPGLNHNFKQASKRNLKNAHFLLISSNELDEKSLVRAGHAAFTAWLQLEEQGYKAQPYSIASLTLVAAKTGHLHADTSKKFRSLFQTLGPEILRRQFQMPESENPVWLLRVGQA